jgi:hypothetical protein
MSPVGAPRRRESLSLQHHRPQPHLFSGQEPGPLRWAAVEAGKWGRARPGRARFEAGKIVERPDGQPVDTAA